MFQWCQTAFLQFCPFGFALLQRINQRNQRNEKNARSFQTFHKMSVTDIRSRTQLKTHRSTRQEFGRKTFRKKQFSTNLNRNSNSIMHLKSIRFQFSTLSLSFHLYTKKRDHHFHLRLKCMTSLQYLEHFPASSASKFMHDIETGLCRLAKSKTLIVSKL